MALILLPTVALCYGLVRIALLREMDQALAGGAAQVLRRIADPDSPDSGERDDSDNSPRLKAGASWFSDSPC